MDKNKNNILILNRQHNINALFYFFKELKSQTCSLCLYSKDQKMIKKFEENGMEARILKKWPIISSPLQCYLFLFFYPVFFLYTLLRLAWFRYKHKINVLIVINAFDKIFSAPVARLLKIKTFALYCPENNNQKNLGLFSLLAEKIASKNKFIGFTEETKEKLQSRQTKDVTIIQPGIKLGLGHQDNIFNNLAKEKDRRFNKKFFSLGTILDLNKKHNLETIFSALKKSREVIPNLQFIVIGDGEERKNLRWLSKQMGIESIVWFVGEQKCMKKWLDGLDAYLCCMNEPSLAEINYALLAMQSKLPLVCQKKTWPAFIQNFKHGLILDNNHSEDWSQALVRLEQNKRQRHDLGLRGKELVEEKYKVERMADDFLRLL